TIGGTSQAITVEWDGRKCSAQRQLADPRSGVAILKIDPEVPTTFFTPGKSDALAVGDPLVAIGYPMDHEIAPSWGTLASFDIRYEGGFLATRHLRAHVPVQRGQGGAPVLNMQGEVVGILISSLDGGSGCFSLPIEAAERVRKDLVMHGELRPGWLGVGCREATQKFAGSSAVIDSLVKSSPGAAAGLEPGDVLLKIDEREIHSPDDVLNASFFIAVRDEVNLRVLREGKIVDVSVTAIDPPTVPLTAGDIPAFARPAADDLTFDGVPRSTPP
ncbi:MAG: S1C family serine protease, partial [Chthoniobacteraceae bacterium]